MFSNMKSVLLFPLFLFLLSPEAYSNSAIFFWTDSNGVVNYGDDPSSAPAGAHVALYQKGPETTDPPQVTQGAFAVELVKELGLKKDPSPRNAAHILEQVRIAPPLGQWDLNLPMSPELTLRLRQLTIASARSGWLKLPEEKALLAFDTASALTGLEISGTYPAARQYSEQEQPPDFALPPSDPWDETPPLVTIVTPIPDYYSYYYWYPVSGGFWAGGFFYSGYYVLNTHRYFYDHHRHDPYYNSYPRRVIGPGSNSIGGPVHGRMIKSDVRSFPQPVSQISGVLRPSISRAGYSNPASFQRHAFLSTPLVHAPAIRVQSSHYTPPAFHRSAGKIQASFHGRSFR
jgi:hypothetical protein